MEQVQTPVAQSEEQEIDLIELAGRIWKRRKFVFKVTGIGVVLGLIVAFSIPKEYETKVKLSPENSEVSKTGQLGGLAAMAGINLGGAAGPDALVPDIYPDIVSSTPFLLELINIPVESEDGEKKMSFYKYMDEHQKKPWWGYVISAPIKLLSWGVSLFKEKEESDNDSIDPFHLTEDQEDFIKGIKEKIVVSVDKKSGVITSSVTMQDPLISATVMNVVLENLQNYITDYRTRKAKHDLAFSEKLFKEAKESYFAAQKAYARYVDENHNVISARFKTEEERLRNEMTLAYGVYNQMAQQLEMDKIKVQKVTPVYTVIEPAKVAIKATKPNKPMILVGFVFLSIVMSVGYILFGETLLNELKNIKNK